MPTKYLTDGTPYTKASFYQGGDLKGAWDLYIKLDGIRALKLQDGTVVSRNSKPLYNLDGLTFTDAEIFSQNWETSTSLVRTQSETHVTQDMVYQLDPPDPRLYYGHVKNPTEAVLNNTMRLALAAGHEGLVIRKGKQWLKVVPELTADVRITGFKAGTGKHEGRLGSVLTNHGNIGTGFDDELRQIIWDNRAQWLDVIIEVGYRELTKDNKLRFPRFKRRRWDKHEESL